MTRDKEIRNAIDTIFPIFNTEKGRTYEQALMATGFEAGVKWADNNPTSHWISMKDKKPEEGVEVIAYHHKWVNEDFNPNGTRIGFINGNGEFTSAYWWDYQDSYLSINLSTCLEDKEIFENLIDNVEPEFWMSIPKSPKCLN